MELYSIHFWGVQFPSCNLIIFIFMHTIVYINSLLLIIAE